MDTDELKIPLQFYWHLYKMCSNRKQREFDCCDCEFLEDCREVFYSIPEDIRLNLPSSKLPAKFI